MPKRTKSSMHRKGPAPKTRYYCNILGCNGIFRNSTDVSRHKWRHLPDHLYPTCPFVGPLGHRCQEKYKGRASDIRIHYEKEHGPYPLNVKFPPLKSILRINNITLGGNSSPAPAAHTTPAVSFSNQVAGPQSTQGGRSFGTMPTHMHFSLDQHHYAAAQEYHAMQQEYPQSFNNGYPQDDFMPMYPLSDNGVQTAMWGHPSFVNAGSPAIREYAPIPGDSAQDYGGHHEDYQGHPVVGQYQHVPPFNQQLENEGWDRPLGDNSSACGNPADAECNPFEPYPALEPDIYTRFP